MPTAVARVARLRGLTVKIGLPDEAAIRTPSAARNHLIAINFDLLAQLGPDLRARLRESAESGATIYVRGALQPGRRFPLLPFSDQQFEFLNRPAYGYQFSTHPILPAAIAGERIITQLNMPLAAGLDDGVHPIVSSLHRSGSGTPSIFSIEAGAGLAIFDLNPDDQYDGRELLSELAAPTTRAANIGALAAVDWTAGRNPAIPVPINLVIDDRPINYDYFNARTLQAFMQHLDDQCPGIHTDFAWTPTHTHPHREYLNVLARHNTGFVWHGFLRHVDHRTIADYEPQLEAGRARVGEITRKYGVRFQPVMIFPYEKDTPRATELLRRAGFVAKVESMGGNPPLDYYRLRVVGEESSCDDEFSVIYRDSIDLLNRDRMLALATLGMPVIALAHPRDLSLRRFQRGDRSSMSYFDSVLTFAAEKSLRPSSLEQIAAEVPTA
ncbi:hypothetical protein [Candidatus Binatus sp.]|uniref:hypothetical protein n=1 Tax=Candidatus Binatus sp. TaxID=2811406 RepID=UPI003C90E494